MKEFLWHIVDDTDQVIAYKPKSQINFQSDIYRVAALWMVNSAGEILIAQRKITKDRDGGKWGPAVAGTVEKGETYESNIYKEAEEEIGLTGSIFRKGLKQRISSPRNYFCQWFMVTLDRSADSFVLQEEEVECLLWISPQQLVREVRTDPEKYIPAFPKVLTVLGVTG